MRRSIIILALLSSTLGAQAPSPSRAADSLFEAKNYAAALDAYEQLVRRDSTNATYWSQLGMSAAYLQRYDRGVTAFTRAATLAGGPVAAYNVGAMHARLGHTDSAFAWLGRAVNVGLGNPRLLQTDEDLASIRSDPRFARLLAGPQPPPMPCANAPENRRFDFWAGEWDVTTRGGSPTGKSSVQIISGGCGLLENWTALNGSNGKSINTYNPVDKIWQQYWVGSGGGVTFYRESVWDGNSISFIARPPSGGGPPNAIVRLTFSPLPDGTVRQHGEQSTDDGKTFVTTYDFIYHRRK
jgi:hypothetical protein